MFNFKKIASATLALTTCMGISTTAFASAPSNYPPNPNVRVINQSEHISKQTIQEIVNGVNASLIYDDGTIVPLESVMTITDVGTSKSRTSNGGNTYQVALRSKVETDSDDKNNEGVTASIYISLWWTDDVGPINTFDSVEGSVDITKGSISSSSYTYGTIGGAGSSTTVKLGTKTSFSKTVNATTFTPTARYGVLFKNTNWELNVSVTPTVFD